MAIFGNEDMQRLDWVLLQNGAITLYYSQEIFESDLAWLRWQEYQIHQFDCTHWQTEKNLHDAMAAQFAFPAYYGCNLEALNDCLSDLIIPNDSGRVIVFHHYDQFAERFPKTAWHVLDIIASQARSYLLFGLRLMALVQSDDPRIAFDSVGACPVMWNRREFLNKNRGL
jgi:RNAse (barnase) inhibitor barstar